MNMNPAFVAARSRPLFLRAAGAVTLLLVAQALLPGAVVAQIGSSPQLVDRIVAIVDEEAILQSDLDREVELYRLEKEYAGETVPQESPEVRREMLERLIESKLIIAAAKQEGMDVDEEAINTSVEAKIQQFVEHFGSMENLRSELRRSGMTLEDYKARMQSQLRDQQYMRLVVGKFIRPNIEVMENEVRDYYLAHLDEMPAEPDSLTISNILIPVQPSVEVRRQVQELVAKIQADLDAGRNFEDVATEFSQGPNAGRGGEVGVVSPGDLFDPNLDRAVFALQLGEISDPVVSSRGVHLLKLDSVRPDGGRAISQIFLPIQVTQEDVDLAKSEIEAARTRVVDGEDFAAVAGQVSGDPISAQQGGLLGTFRLEDLSPQFQEVLAEAFVGQITEPVLTPAGWYVFQVQDRVTGHMYTYEELRDQLRQMVEGEKIEGALADYVTELRTRFFIDEKS